MSALDILALAWKMGQVKTLPTALTSTDMWHGARLVRALLMLAAEYARQHAMSDAVIVAALGSAFGTAGASAVRVNGYDLASYETLLVQHVARVLRAESVAPTYH